MLLSSWGGVGLSPRWELVRGARRDTYRGIWAVVFELEPGDVRFAQELATECRATRGSVHNAMRNLAAVGIVRRHKDASINAPVSWVRLPWPGQLCRRCHLASHDGDCRKCGAPDLETDRSVTWEELIAAGVPSFFAHSFLQGLRGAGYLEIRNGRFYLAH